MQCLLRNDKPDTKCYQNCERMTERNRAKRRTISLSRRKYVWSLGRTAELELFNLRRIKKTLPLPKKDLEYRGTWKSKLLMARLKTS